jgi:rhomboid family GlyGly-CTERM serine protease
VAWALPDLSGLLRFEHGAVLDGQWWRLGTAPLAHFSGEHLAWNLLLVVAAGWVAEASGYRHLGLALALGGLLPGPVVLILRPGLATYGGLSGVATAAVTYVALCRLATTQRRPGRLLWAALLVLVLAKPLVELASGAPLFASPGPEAWRVLPEAHGLGVLAGWLAARRTRRRP